MDMFKKTLFSILLFITNSLLYADSPINQVFDLEEDRAPDLFSPARQTTQSFEEWIYRYYPQTNYYLGVNREGEVYMLDATHNKLKFIAPMYELYDLLVKNGTKVLKTGNPQVCKTIPLLGTVDKKVIGIRIIYNREKLNKDLDMDIIEKTKSNIGVMISDKYSSAYQNVSYKKITIDKKEFNIIRILYDGDDILLPPALPTHLCQGMKWKSPLYVYDTMYLIENRIASINETIILAGGSSRNTIKIEILLNDDNDYNDNVIKGYIWIDSITGYIVKAEGEGYIGTINVLALSIENSDFKK